MLDLILKEYAAYYRKQFDEDLSDYVHSKYGSFLASPHTIIVVQQDESDFPIGIIHLGTVNDWGEIRLFYIRPTFFTKDLFTTVWLKIAAHFPQKVKKVVFQSRLFSVAPYTALETFDVPMSRYTRSEYRLDMQEYMAVEKSSPFEFTPVLPSDKKSLAFLSYLTFKNSLEYDIIPYYQNIDYAQALVKNITNNTMGVFLSDISFIVKKENVPVGLILSSKLKDNNVLLLVFGLFEALRGKGFGKQLLNDYLNMVAEKGYAGITLTVTEENASAVALYQQAGFKQGSRFPLYVHELQRRPQQTTDKTIKAFEPRSIGKSRKE